MRKKIFILFIVILLPILFIPSCFSPKLNLEKSENFDGERFVNLIPPDEKKTFSKFLKWRFQTKREKWPEWVDIVRTKPEFQIVSEGINVTFINHTTLLVQIDGVNIITDPIYSDRASPFSFIGPKRVRLPGVKFDDLPKIDVILISHNHYDHFDKETLDRLILRDDPKILFGIGNSFYLNEKNPKNIIEMNWGDEFKFKNLKFTFLSKQHWSKRNLFDTNKSLWGSFAIEGSKKIYFAGDTGYSNHFKNIQKKFEYFDLSLIPIGAYEPRWFMKYNHMNPEEAVQAHIDLKSKKSIATHFGTFQLTNESIDDPVKDLKIAREKYNIKESDFFTLKEGGSYFIE
jgi:L-ascorbate metabolism protein UlaG (beta-lactamase superfamily)